MRLALPAATAVLCYFQPFAIGAGHAAGKTYTFVHTATRQQIQVECSADPKSYSRDWWQANCKPVDGNAADWTGSARYNHPDFLWVPTNLD